MAFITAILSIAVFVTALFYLNKRPVNILSCYLFAVPVLPPIPVGSIEITVLDLLTIPTLIALIYHWPKNGWSLKGYFNIGFFLYIAAAIISFFSFFLQTGIFSAGLMMRLIRLIEMFLPVLLASLLLPKMTQYNILKPFMIGGAIASGVAILFYLFGYSMRISQQFAAEGLQIFRAAGTHGDSGSFGTLAGLTLLVSVWVLIYLRETGKKFLQDQMIWLAGIAGILSIGALVLSLSRGGVVLFGLGLIIILIPLMKRPVKLIKIITIGLIIILIGAAFINTFIDNNLVSVGLDAFWNRITGLSELTNDFDRVSSNRTYYWQKTWELFKNNPAAWPFGLGYKSIPLHYNLLPDNNFNQALFELGIAGAAGFLAMLIMGIYAGLRTLYRHTEYGIIILAAWIGIISNMISADVMTYWHDIPAIFILMVFFSRNNSQS